MEKGNHILGEGGQIEEERMMSTEIQIFLSVY